MTSRYDSGTPRKIAEFRLAALEYDEDWGSSVQSTVEEVMWALDSSIDEEVDEPEDYLQSPSGYPYCGCPTCVLRETAYMVTILAAQGVKDGKVRLGDG